MDLNGNNNKPNNENISAEAVRARRVAAKKAEMRSKVARANVFLMAMLVFGIGIFLLLAKRPTVSSIESRSLAKFPEFTVSSYISGEYTAGIQEWFTDTVPNRDGFKKNVVRIRGLFGVSPELTVIRDVSETSGDERPSEEVSDPFDNSEPEPASEDVSYEESELPSEEPSAETPSEEEPTEEPTEPSEEPSEEPSQEESSNPPGPVDEFGVINNLLILGDRCLASFGGSYDSGQLYAKYVAEYKSLLGDDVSVYSMIVPTSAAIYLTGDRYDKYGGKQIDKLSYIAERFQGTGVTSVDLFSALNPHKDEDIYFRTDHHWTMLGAYYAAKALAEQAGLPFDPVFNADGSVNTDNYKYVGKFNDDGTPKPFLGSLYGQTQAEALLKSPETFFWYEYQGKYTCEWYDYGFTKQTRVKENSCFINFSDAYISSWYSIYIGGDGNSLKITTDAGNGKVAVVFKDSYGNALVPMLLSSFETIYVADIRHFPLDSIDFLKKVGATDVIFAVSASTSLGVHYKYIRSMRNNTQKYERP